MCTQLPWGLFKPELQLGVPIKNLAIEEQRVFLITKQLVPETARRRMSSQRSRLVRDSKTHTRGTQTQTQEHDGRTRSRLKDLASLLAAASHAQL